MGGREGDRRRFGGVCGGSVKPQSTTRADGVSSAVSLRHSNTGLQRRTRLGPTGENGPARPASLCPPGVCLDDASRANRGVLGDRDAYRPLTPHVQPPHPPQPPPWCAGEGRAGDNNGRVDPPTHPTTTPPHAADRAVARWQSGGEPEWGHLDLLGGEGETGRPSRGGGRGARRVLPAAAAPGVCSQPMGGGGPRRDRSGVHARFLHDESGAAVPCFSPKPLSIGTERAFIGGLGVHPLRCCVMVGCGQSPAYITQLQRRKVLTLYLTSTVWPRKRGGVLLWKSVTVREQHTTSAAGWRGVPRWRSPSAWTPQRSIRVAGRVPVNPFWDRHGFRAVLRAEVGHCGARSTVSPAVQCGFSASQQGDPLFLHVRR